MLREFSPIPQNMKESYTQEDFPGVFS